MKTEKKEKEYFIATMYKGDGIYTDYKITKTDTDIYFVRNKNGVNGWHCGSLSLNDYRIEKIRPCPKDWED